MERFRILRVHTNLIVYEQKEGRKKKEKEKEKVYLKVGVGSPPK